MREKRQSSKIGSNVQQKPEHNSQQRQNFAGRHIPPTSRKKLKIASWWQRKVSYPPCCVLPCPHLADKINSPKLVLASSDYRICISIQSNDLPLKPFCAVNAWKSVSIKVWVFSVLRWERGRGGERRDIAKCWARYYCRAGAYTSFMYSISSIVLNY